MGVGIGAIAILAALVIAANIWPRGSSARAEPSASPQRSDAVPGGPVSLILHSWQRPLPVTPGMDKWGSGFLSLAGDHVAYGREPGPAASKSAVAVADLGILEMTATAETRECAVGDVGTYRWSVEGKATVMILTAISPDACAPREAAVAGTWVRSDLPVAAGPEPALPPGTHLTSAFDPFGAAGVPKHLSYTVREGWAIVEDVTGDVVLHHHSEAVPGEGSTETYIAVFAQPTFSAVEDGAPCEATSGAIPGEHGAADIAAAIVALEGVETTRHEAVTIDGYRGQILDLRVATRWTGGCTGPDGQVARVPFLLRGPEPGPTLGVSPNNPLRLILLDLTGGRTMAVGIFGFGPDRPPPLEELVAVAMPVVESFEFQGPAKAAPSEG